MNTTNDNRPADIKLPEGWTWERVEAERAKWGTADNMVPVVTVPGACTAWVTINSIRQTRVDWMPVTEERFDEMLGCMPPALMTRGGFLVGEAYDCRTCRISSKITYTYQAFVRVGGKCFEAREPLTVAEFRVADLPGEEG